MRGDNDIWFAITVMPIGMDEIFTNIIVYVRNSYQKEMKGLVMRIYDIFLAIIYHLWHNWYFIL